jgi:type VI secretion system protein ImpE
LGAIDLFQSGQLQQAVDAVTQTLKTKPTDVTNRLFLAELLCFVGDWERAEKQLDTISRQSTEGAITIALYRQLLRGETAREQVFHDGRPPEIVVELPQDAQLMLEALMAQRLGQDDELVRLQQAADAARSPVAGQCNGHEFVSFRDLDDRVAGVLEVITSQGKYYWVPWQNIELLEMEPPKVPIDLLYRRTQIDVRGGPKGEVYIPTRYVASQGEIQSTPLLMCRATEWLGVEGQFVEGRGLRTFLVGEQDMTLMEISTLSFTAPQP